MADKKLYEGLKKNLRGQVIVPGDPDYDQRRRIWNLDIDRYPAAIARCVDEDDVRAAVCFANQAGIEDVAVRGGGHSYAGLSTCDNGLVIDLGLMRGARAGDNNRVFLQGGAHLSHMDTLTNQMGTAVPAGVEATTGVAGLTLGGGVGMLQRRFGLTCDSLRSVRMVTADGDIVVADDKTAPELMWGLRGGGGNFGIVTEFEFQSYPISPSFVSNYFIYPLDKQQDFARFFDEFVRDMPKDLANASVLPKLTPGMTQQMIRGVGSTSMPSHIPLDAGDFFAVNALWVGSPEGAEKAIKPFLDWNPVAKISMPTTHLQMQSMAPQLGIPQNRYVRGGFLNSVGTGVLAACVDMINRGQPPGMMFVFMTLGGAVAEVGEQDTAFSGRSTQYLYALEVSWNEPAQREPTIAWIRKTYDAIEKFATGGNYTNIVTDEGSDDKRGLRGIPPREARVRQVFGQEKFRRLRRLKSQWDPNNLFHVNVNIPPEAKNRDGA